MQTFAPYDSLYKSAEVLDRKRLNKQITETLQIHRSLTIPTYGWKSHPAVKMWSGYECALVLYNATMAHRWIAGGGRTHLSMTKLLSEHAELHQVTPCEPEMPSWWGDKDFHRSHRSNLLRKAPEHYASIFERDLPDNLKYVWPNPLTK
jgi:hypothetical protein